MSTARAPSASAFSTSIPRRTPPSSTTSARPATGESTVRQSAMKPAASARRASSRMYAWSSKRYGWNHSGHPAAPPTSSMVRFAPIESAMKVFAMVAARAIATSPSGSRRHCSANGAMPMGMATCLPRIVVARLRPLVSTSTRGTNCHRAKASMLSRMVRSSPAPPATYTYAPGVRRSLAAAWNSGTVRRFETSTRSRTMVTARSARLHPVQKADEVPPRGTGDVEVEDLLGAGGRCDDGVAGGPRRRVTLARFAASRFLRCHIQMRDSSHGHRTGQVSNVRAVRNADLIIANARLVTPRGVIDGGAAIRDGRFIAIGDDDTLPDAERRIDARGRLVFPGLVDPHVHLGGAFPYEQNLVTECRSAAAGGVTTLLQYRRSPTTFAETFPGELDTNRRKMGLDTAFHFIISSLDQAEGIPEYAERWGVRSFKLYMGGYAPGNPIGLVPVDDGVLFRAMELIRELGPYAYCMVHAENQGLYMLLTERAHRSGRLDLSAYAMSHPAFIEEEAVARITWLGELARCAVYVVHTTTRAAIASAVAARHRGARVVIETCPHYLALTIDDARLLSQGSAIGKVSPPLRDAAA